MRHHFDLDLRPARQRRRLHGGTRRKIRREIPRIDFIHGGEIRQVCQENRRLDNMPEIQLLVLRRMILTFSNTRSVCARDVLADNLPRCGNHRNLPRAEEEIPRAHALAVRPDGRRADPAGLTMIFFMRVVYRLWPVRSIPRWARSKLGLKERGGFVTFPGKCHQPQPVMPPLKILFRAGRKEVTVGTVPRVVGTLCSLARPFPPPRRPVCCDVVEVRLDKAGCPPGWPARCQEIERQGWPVLLTLRLKSEGGAWTGRDANRFDIFEEGIMELAGVDIEWRSKIMFPVAILAKRKRKICVVSYHDFEKTPPVEKLAEVVAEAQELASIVKIATRLNERG